MIITKQLYGRICFVFYPKLVHHFNNSMVNKLEPTNLNYTMKGKLTIMDHFIAVTFLNKG